MGAKVKTETYSKASAVIQAGGTRVVAVKVKSTAEILDIF